MLNLVSSNENFVKYGEPVNAPKSYTLSTQVGSILMFLSINGVIRFIIPKFKLIRTNILGTICELISILICTSYFNNIRQNLQIDYLFEFINCIFFYGAGIMGLFPWLFPWYKSYYNLFNK